MTEPGKDRDEALATAGRLTGALEGMSGELERLNDYGHRSRQLIWLTIISLAIDLVVTVIVAVFAVQAHEANITATANHASNLAACRAGNVTRAGEVRVWEHLLSLVPPPSAKARKLDAEFIAYVKNVWAPRNCAKIYRVP